MTLLTCQTIHLDNPEFDKDIPDIFPAELQSFLDLNIIVIGSDVHTSVFDKTR